MRHVSAIQRRFGIPEEVFEPLDAIQAQDTVFVGTREVMRFHAVNPMRRGVRLCRIFSYSTKPTTWAMQVLGNKATRNVITLTEEQARSVINGGELRIEADAEDGFVLLRWQEFVIGVGLYKRPLLKSQIPRFRSVDEPVT
jgi:NOL1/NOP2/fmu family ribosome biogenesis protein